MTEDIEDEYNIIFGSGVIDLTDIPDDVQGRERVHFGFQIILGVIKCGKKVN
ncbi:MAG: hypothetical protein ACOC5A_01610 [Halanaerobiales bacterium]